MADYEQQVVWILRQTGLTPVQLKDQYMGYKGSRAAYEAGYGAVDDMTALITPGVGAMLDLEDRMLSDFTAEQQSATAEVTPTRWRPTRPTVIIFLCVAYVALVVGLALGGLACG